MTSDLLRISLYPPRNLCFSYDPKSNVHGFSFSSLPQRRRSQRLWKVSGRRAPNFNFIFSKAIDIRAPVKSTPLTEEQRPRGDSPLLLDVTGMVCGACVARVKSVLSADERVESAVVNMLTETAAVRIRPEVVEETVGTA
ncbi:Copper-transporting ATPase PAA2, chloroplastic [Vitis vinifera]|uniref:Copper-transporting ATPase PAA2, chloroplastic n=1 Tax=Vitis vinifera TaxID=29760 RepID=A0A438EWX7_VITVI|nr:Copper-transporting ATPase PAA2, chloroplastic [Vitis vinifera]